MVAAVVAVAWLAVPTSPIEGGMAAPLTGNLRLSSGGFIAPLVLIYGPDAGLTVVRAPTAGGPRVIPITSADRELHVISLGVSPLTIQADIVGRLGVQSLRATGRMITLFQTESQTGVQPRF